MTTQSGCDTPARRAIRLEELRDELRLAERHLAADYDDLARREDVRTLRRAITALLREGEAAR